MHTFLGWHGAVAHQAAMALKAHGPDIVGRGCRFFESSMTPPGVDWSNHIGSQLRRADAAVVCVASPSVSGQLGWELGFLDRFPTPYLPYVINMDPAQLRHPLHARQAVRADRTGTLRLMAWLARRAAVPTRDLATRFETVWPLLAEEIAQAVSVGEPNSLVGTWEYISDSTSRKYSWGGRMRVGDNYRGPIGALYLVHGERTWEAIRKGPRQEFHTPARWDAELMAVQRRVSFSYHITPPGRRVHIEGHARGEIVEWDGNERPVKVRAALTQTPGGEVANLTLCRIA